VTPYGRVLEATNDCFTATQRVEHRLRCRAASGDLERQLWVGSASSVDRTADPQSAQDASRRGKTSSDRFGGRASLRRFAPMAAVL
jgi:hypothetical protein